MGCGVRISYELLRYSKSDEVDRDTRGTQETRQFRICTVHSSLAMKTTGNSGGSHNLSFTSDLTKSRDNFVGMLKKMGTGLLVTELMGQGVNYITGDYSRGATGFWVENGVIQYPVEEITIAGNLTDMFRQIVAVGSDTITRGTKQTGSILIENMTIAGN